MNQTIRIIGGRFRGKKINFPQANSLRPTPDRIRETLFNWLMHDIQGARCLDAFAGSGALGFEAYSRGALSVVLVEKAREVYLNLKKISSTLHPEAISVIHQDAINYIKNHPNPHQDAFDIAFIDPPFAKRELLDIINILASSALLKTNGLLYLESDSELSLDPNFFLQLKQKRAGLVVYALYKKIANSNTVT